MTDRDAIEKMYNDMPENDEQAEAWSLAISALQERVARCVGRDNSDDCAPKDDQSTDNAPAIDPVRRGRWKITEYEYYDCSICGESYYSGADSSDQAQHWLENGDAYRFCPHCGAKMYGGEDE